MRRALLLAAALAGCKGGSAQKDTEMAAANADAAGAIDDASATSEPSADAALADLDAGDLPKAAALESPTPIFIEKAWPARDPTKASDDRKGVIRLGYL